VIAPLPPTNNGRDGNRVVSADLLREMIGFAAQRLMELETDGLCGAGHGERSDARRNHPNGYRDRDWATRAGTVELVGSGAPNPQAAPRQLLSRRSASLLNPRAPPHRRTAEKALTAVIQEAYVQGISTRSVDSRVQALGMEGIGKSQVSRLCVEIDERVGAFLSRPIEGEWPYLRLDATYNAGRAWGPRLGRPSGRRRPHRGLPACALIQPR
jgi:putative transposase